MAYNSCGTKRGDVLDEMQLILSCQKGEKEAFDSLIRLYYPYVLKFLMKLTSEESLSEDLVQETFIKLIRRIDTFDVKRESSFSTYLMTIARNCYLDHMRKNRLAEFNIDDFELADRIFFEERVINDFDIAEMMNEVENLPYEQGEAIRLKYLERYTLQEIADRFGTESKTIKSRIHSGMSKLRAKFANN
jgi:RNA polymerase sigma-70 factor, ECF subfamily